MAPRLLAVCCVCGLIRDELRRPLILRDGPRSGAYQKIYGVKTTECLLTHTYCPGCFPQAQNSARKYFGEIGRTMEEFNVMNGRPARQTKKRRPQMTFRPQDKIVASAATDTNQSPVSAPADFYSLIAKRAYEIHAERGFRQGYALDEWLEAEREILNRSRGQ